ncbi:hypothetical protein BN946_scf184501.g10 [Trametes cinnabarina]|uniref:Uncharacterized protein n=1 Tax=Pycnoporus cinnabarinus TaxID=5643 RepID=A0A060SRU1_PYCCI|nr:hypothetical protein BN946_scf184501.g10 [Trametes cinnabarina]
MRNNDRNRRREAGEEVDEDEELLDLAPTPPREDSPPRGGQQTLPSLGGQTPPPTTGNERDIVAAEVIARAVTAAVVAVLKPDREASSCKKSLKDLDKLEEGPERPEGSSAPRRHRIDRRLVTLLKLGFHLPLTLCTDEAIEAIRAQPSMLSDKRYTDAEGNKVTIVDVTAGWPDERSISSEDWKDAWTNLLQILPEVLKPDAVNRLRAHFDYLRSQTNFKVRFPAILRFDIDIRQNYFWGKECEPFRVGSQDYVSELIQRQNDVAMEMAARAPSRGTDHSAAETVVEGMVIGVGAEADVEVSRVVDSQAVDSRAEVSLVEDAPFEEAGRRRPRDLSASSADRADTGRQNASPSNSSMTNLSSLSRTETGSSRSPLGSNCASLGTLAADSPVTAGLALVARTRTSAPTAGPRIITPVVSGVSERDRVITTYRADEIEEELKAWGLWEKHATLTTRLRAGFHIGDMRPLTTTFTPENHKGGKENITFIENYTREQVLLGHMTGPYSAQQVREILGSHFRSSPLSVVEKSSQEPGKLRLIQNCSFRDEDGVSVNDMISSEDFPTRWGTATEVAEIIADAPPGLQMATLDVDSAFRRIPIHPAHKQYLVIQQREGEFFIDHVCPFGVRSGPGLQGAPMDATVDLLDARGWGPNKKWVDDLSNFRRPCGYDNEKQEWTYAHSVEDIFALGEKLGIPWHGTKWCPHDDVGVYLGFSWDIPHKTVSLPERKRLKYLARVEHALDLVNKSAKRMTLETAQKLSGTLSHCAFVFPRGRTYLSGLFTFVASFTNEHVPRYPPKSVISDLKWWRDLLRRKGERRVLVPKGPVQDVDAWVDASSSWGIGIVLGKEWDAWRWKGAKETWHRDSRDIGWAEMIALELAVRKLIELGWVNAELMVRSDNEGVIKAFKRGRSRNWQVNLAIRRTELLCMEKNLKISPVYVNTKDNRADPVSRGERVSGITRFKSSLQIPQEVSEFITYA